MYNGVKQPDISKNWFQTHVLPPTPSTKVVFFHLLIDKTFNSIVQMQLLVIYFFHFSFDCW